MDYDLDTSSIISPCFEPLDEQSTLDNDYDDDCHEEEWIDEGVEDLDGDFCDAELFQLPTGPPRRPGQPRRLVLPPSGPPVPPPPPMPAPTPPGLPVSPPPRQPVPPLPIPPVNGHFDVEPNEVEGIVAVRNDGAQSISTAATSTPDGFVMVGNNIDKNVRPSFLWVDRKTDSWHCFHSYAVYNHINVSNLKDSIPSGEVSSTSVLLNMTDQQKKIVKTLKSLCQGTVQYIHIQV